MGQPSHQDRTNLTPNQLWQVGQALNPVTDPELGRTGVRPKRERGEESHCSRGRQPPRIPRAAGYAPVGSDRPPWIIVSTAASGECNDLEVGGAKRQEARGQEEGHSLPLSPSPER